MPIVKSKKNMPCNKPQKSWRPSKKRVVKACSKGKEKIIHFGATGYGNNYNSIARKNFRSRHKCDTANDKFTARYWACKNLWSKGANITSCPKSRKCKGSPRKSPNKKSKRKSPRKSQRRSPRKSQRRSPRKSQRRSPGKSQRRSPRKSQRRSRRK